MRREAVLPIEFAPLHGQVQYVQRKSANEYSSTCPRCGGSIHPNGEWPNRFIMWVHSKVTGGPLGLCRRCNYKWWPGKDQAADDWRPDAEEIARRAKAAEEALQREIKRAQAALDELREARRWLEYHATLEQNSKARQLWRRRGVPDWWQDWWKVGYAAQTRWSSPSLTIPVWQHGWQVQNIKHRLLQPNGKGKYRNEQSGVPAAPFFCDPDTDRGPLFLAEGEIKAMVTFVTLDSDKIQVAGLPSATPGAEMLATLDNYEPIWLCLDPDANADKVARALGPERVRIVTIPAKIDDAINAGALTKDDIRRYCRMARKAR